MTAKMTDRNPHTGEKLQSKANSDAFRNNFDLIFGKKEEAPKLPGCAMQGIRACCGQQDCVHKITWYTPPSYADKFTIADFDPNLCSPWDGDGYYGTDTAESNWYLGKTETPPVWATHVYWYNK